MRARVLIIDDHPVVLYGLRFLFSHDRSFEVCGEAANSAAARSQAEALQPDFIICDLVLGGRDGMEMVQDLGRSAPNARILVYSSQNEWTFARRALQAGAKGYVAKSEGLERVATALSAIARNQVFVSDDVRARLIELGESDASLSEKPNTDALSNRELQVLRLIGTDTPSREIAAALGLSIKTVATYRERLKVKFKLSALGDLQTLAREHVKGNS